MENKDYAQPTKIAKSVLTDFSRSASFLPSVVKVTALMSDEDIEGSPG